MGGGNGGRIVNPFQAEEPAGALVRIPSAQSTTRSQFEPRSGYNVPEQYDVVERFSKQPRSRQVPQSMRDQLNAVSSRKPSNTYMSSPDGPSIGGRDRREVTKRLQRENLRRRVGIGAAGAGAAAGLAALINGERDEREQEAYR